MDRKKVRKMYEQVEKEIKKLENKDNLSGEEIVRLDDLEQIATSLVTKM